MGLIITAEILGPTPVGLTPPSARLHLANPTVAAASAVKGAIAASEDL